MRGALIVIVSGCTVVERTPPPPQPDPPLSSALFTPVLCTSGAIGDVSGCSTGGPCCPFNTIDLSVEPFSIDGATFWFVAQPLTDTGLYVSSIELVAGPDGLYVENLRFAGESCSSDVAGMTFDLAPAATVTLQNQTLIGVAPYGHMCFVVDAIGPFRP
jgi:hypothetical protein